MQSLSRSLRRRSHQLFARHPHVSLSKGLPPSNQEDVSDVEWEIRTGRAIYILEQTLPDFFQVGLVSTWNEECIYSPSILLRYTPPVALPPPFPRTLSVEGLPLYMTSSVFIRHTMKTLYSDLRVEMRKLVVHSTTHRKREKSLFVGLTVLGTTRVSGGLGEWQVNSTYGFSPVTGLIHLHTVDSIQPAPHQAVFTSQLIT